MATVAERPVELRPDPADTVFESQGKKPGTRLLNLTFVVLVPGAGVILAITTLLMGRVQPFHVGMLVAEQQVRRIVVYRDPATLMIAVERRAQPAAKHPDRREISERNSV